MNNYTREDILRMVEEEDVGFIRLQFTDIFGTMKNIAITTSQLEKALDNEIMFDGSSIEGFARVEESDMYLYPNLNTFEIFPWRPQQGKVARLICDVYKPDGTPYESDPRYILKKVMEDAKEMGYEFNVGPELEFFLFHTDDDGLPTTLSHESAGYFDLGPLDLGENARRDMVLTLEDMGFEIESSHHEAAPAQHEIDFRYDEALTTADNIMTFKLTVRTVAKRHGLHATFMPKPNYGKKGSAMFFNMFLSKDGENIFSDPDEEYGLSKTAYYFMGGIKVNLDSKTSMEHLYAVGETSCNGVHGKNRLASNSLLEALVFAKAAAKDITEHPSKAETVEVDLSKYQNEEQREKENEQLVLDEIKRKDRSFYDQWCNDEN